MDTATIIAALDEEIGKLQKVSPLLSGNGTKTPLRWLSEPIVPSGTSPQQESQGQDRSRIEEAVAKQRANQKAAVK